MIIDLDLLDLLHGLLNQCFPIQFLLCIQQLANGGLGLGMLGGKDSTAVQLACGCRPFLIFLFL